MQDGSAESVYVQLSKVIFKKKENLMLSREKREIRKILLPPFSFDHLADSEKKTKAHTKKMQKAENKK